MTGAAMRWVRVDTALGPVGLGWTDAGLARVVLPGDRADGPASDVRSGAAQPAWGWASGIRRGLPGW